MQMNTLRKLDKAAARKVWLKTLWFTSALNFRLPFPWKTKQSVKKHKDLRTSSLFRVNRIEHVQSKLLLRFEHNAQQVPLAADGHAERSGRELCEVLDQFQGAGYRAQLHAVFPVRKREHGSSFHLKVGENVIKMCCTALRTASNQ